MYYFWLHQLLNIELDEPYFSIHFKFQNSRVIVNELDIRNPMRFSQ